MCNAVIRGIDVLDFAMPLSEALTSSISSTEPSPHDRGLHKRLRQLRHQAASAMVETNVFSRWHCTVCDGCTNPVSVLAEGKDGKRAIRVCEQCLEAAEIDKRLAATAAAHERHAAYLRSLVGRLRVPTYAEWKARIEKVEASRPWRLAGC